MKDGIGTVDFLPVDVWFRHLSDLFTRDDASVRTVRNFIAAAAKRSDAVGFALRDSDSEAASVPKTDAGIIESLERDSILILTPKDAAIHFDVGAHLTMCIASEAGYDVGEVVMLGEWVHRDQKTSRCGIRVSIPTSLEHVQRRDHHRLPVAFDLSPRVKLADGESAAPIGRGDILDISESGARLYVDLSAALVKGAKVTVDAIFPESFPSFKVMAEVAHVGRPSADGRIVLGVHFAEKPAELARAIHRLEIRRARRMRK